MRTSHRTSRTLAAVCASGLFAAACSDPTESTVTQLNLDRPIDIAFACHGEMRVTEGNAPDGSQPIVQTAQPTVSCELRSPQVSPDQDVALPVPPGQEEIGGTAPKTPAWYAFILQSASGTVAIARWLSRPTDTFSGSEVGVLDADPLTPGKNAISVGEDPVAIATDKSGCWEVTANAGSCDMSALEINSAVDTNSPAIRVDRLAVRNGAGTLMRAKPAAMVAEPNGTTVGLTCPMAPTGLVYVAYPSCGLVAAVDLSDGQSGKIVAGIQFDAAGAPTVLSGDALTNLTCVDECAGAPLPAMDQRPKRPVALALRRDTRVNTTRLAIGADNSSLVTIVNLDDQSLPQAMMPVTQIQLQDPGQSLGISGLALSPQIGMGGTRGIDDVGGPGGQNQYVYAVATDGTVRVAEVLKNIECDTQVDARFLRGVRDVPLLQCFPVGSPETPPRRTGAKGPGIQLTGDGVPTSVAIVKGLSAIPTSVVQSTLVGYFAIITSSNGRAFVVNVDDDRGPDEFDPGLWVGTAPALIMAHQLRDSVADRDAKPEESENGVAVPSCTVNDPLVATTGGPRSTAMPTRTIPDSTLSADVATAMPGLRQVACFAKPGVAPEQEISELQFAAPQDVRDVVYPELRNATTQSWTAVWEGPLSLDSDLIARDGRRVRQGQMAVKDGMRLTDGSQPFCEMGVEPYDIVQFRGCNPANADLDCPGGYTCFVHPDSKVSGIGSCMKSDEAGRLANACRDFLVSMRRYTVGGNADGRVESGTLRLLPRQHELYATPIDGCVSDQQCDDIARYVAGHNAAADLYTANRTKWSCQADPLRAPINADPAANKRCVQTCGFHTLDEGSANYDALDRDADCATGTICVGATPEGARGTCMEGVVPPQSCVNGPQMFDVRVSEAFMIRGTDDGYVHPFIEAADGSCQRDPDASRLQVGRIPLKAPACDPAADPFTGRRPDGTLDANPCSTTVEHYAKRRVYTGDNCTLASEPIEARQADAIRFSNRSLTIHLVDPTYPGDGPCNVDRLGPFTGAKVPMVPPGSSPTVNGYTLTFDTKVGFSPLFIPNVTSIYPVKVVRGPSESIWIMDEGDFLSTTIGVPSTRGQVYRVESAALSPFNLLQ